MIRYKLEFIQISPVIGSVSKLNFFNLVNVTNFIQTLVSISNFSFNWNEVNTVTPVAKNSHPRKQQPQRNQNRLRDFIWSQLSRRRNWNTFLSKFAFSSNITKQYEDMMDLCSYAHNLSSCEIKAWKKCRAEPALSNKVMYVCMYVCMDSNSWPLR